MSSENKKTENLDKSKERGFVLLLTLVLLISLSTLGYVLTSRLLESRSRNQYLVDYTQARYACDSGVKYALATISQIRATLISRPNEPDFSDLFNLTEAEYQNFLAEWAERKRQEEAAAEVMEENVSTPTESNDVNSLEDVNNSNILASDDYNEPVVVRGPYGFSWPFVYAPVEFEIGSAKVTIEIEDENAKYPLALALLGDENLARESEAGLQTFLRWMWNRIEQDETIGSSIETIEKQLEQIKEIKQFTTDFKAVATTESAEGRQAAQTAAQRRAAASAARTSAAGAKAATTRTTTVRSTAADQQRRQSSDFARIFHSSLIDVDLLARPTIESPTRKESALKYMSLFAATKVNINTAPRQVLESVFVFGGKEREIADEIILKRRIKPFGSIDELKKELFSFSDSIDKCKNFISTESTLFTIKVIAVSGAARSSVLIAVSREGNQTRQVALIAS